MNKTLTVVVKTDKGDIFLNIADTELYSPSIVKGNRTTPLPVKKYDLCGYPYAEVTA